MYFTHSLAGALTSKLFIDKVDKDLTEKEVKILWIAGITASVLPDFDLLYAIPFHNLHHRYFISHSIFVYLVLAFLIFVFSRFLDKKKYGRKFHKYLSLVFLLGVVSHIFFDFFIGGVVLFAPFSYKLVGFILEAKGKAPEWLLYYLHSYYMIVEFFLSAIFLLLMKSKKYLFAKMVALFYVVVAVSIYGLLFVIAK